MDYHAAKQKKYLNFTHNNKKITSNEWIGQGIHA